MANPAVAIMKPNLLPQFSLTIIQFKNILKGVDVVLSEEMMLEINQLYKKFPITF